MQTTMMSTATPRAWYDLPLTVWDAGAPRREKAEPAKTDYFGEERRYMGRPEIGLHPLEDVCKRIAAQARRIQEAAAVRREYEALHTAREYDRLYANVGFYAVEMICEAQGITRAEFSARLALANALGECA